jgi:hypothetical protein
VKLFDDIFWVLLLAVGLGLVIGIVIVIVIGR